MAAAHASAAAGQSQVLLITGEAGIGKTRLIEELIRRRYELPPGAFLPARNREPPPAFRPHSMPISRTKRASFMVLMVWGAPTVRRRFR